MVLNLGKCPFMCLGQNIVDKAFVYNNTDMKSNKRERKYEE